VDVAIAAAVEKRIPHLIPLPHPGSHLPFSFVALPLNKNLWHKVSKLKFIRKVGCDSLHILFYAILLSLIFFCLSFPVNLAFCVHKVK